MLIDLHILQNYAPSNLNRDGNGAPKDCVFGGVRRGRISSQNLKRTMRKSEMFTAAFAGDDLLASRTQLLPRLLGEELTRQGVDSVTVQAIVRRAADIGQESGKANGGADAAAAADSDATDDVLGDRTKQLIFVAPNEVTPLAEQLLALYNADPKKFGKMKTPELVGLLGTSVPRSVDVALSGRMTTSAAFQDVQAAGQVAHAIGTHRLEQESDYYTAMDDIAGEANSAFMGDTEYNSSTYYRYMSIHWEQLVANLGGDTELARRTVGACIRATALSYPSGKQNSFAAHNLPDLVMVEVREQNLPLSYANAFLRPVRATRDRSLMDVSIAALSHYIERTVRAYDIGGTRAYFTVTDETVADARQLTGLRQLIEWLPLPGGDEVSR